MASIRKRKWRGKDGSDQTAWVVDYFDQKGKRHLKTFPTKGAAGAWKTDALHQVKIGTHTPASTSKTVAEAWALWVAECEDNGLERSTVRQRKQHLELHVKPFIGNVKLAELTAPRVEQFDADLRKEGR